MTYKKIREMAARKESLTDTEKTALANGILKNKRAREEAIEGALIKGNLELAFAFMFDNVIVHIPEK